jgi:hypothetical protein
MDQNELPLDPCHLGVLLGAPKMIFEPLACLAQTVHLSCVEINCTELPLDPCHLGVPSGARKMISKPTACSAQTRHLSYVKITTISKETKISFHFTCVTLEFHRLCPKWFMSLWYVHPNLCTYLAPRLTLSSNGPKPASTRPMSPRSSIGCSKNNIRAYCTFSANRATILRRD